MENIKAKKYMKCSAYNVDSVKDVIDVAITLAIQNRIKNERNSNKLGSKSLTKSNQALANELTTKEDKLNTSGDTVILQNSDSQQNIFFNTFSSKKKFSNSTELGDENFSNQKIIRELTLEMISKGIELPINVEEVRKYQQREPSMSGDEERGMKKKKEKRTGLCKRRSLSRRLCCSRVNNDTSCSLNKI